MYTAPQKKFRARDEAEVLESIRLTGERYGDQVRRVFLADGDATVLPTRRLLAILAAIRSHLPAVRRISSYCLPRNLRKKSLAEVDELAAAGLSMVYVGAESGDDQVLAALQTRLMQTASDRLHLLGQIRPADGLPNAINFLAQCGRCGALGSVLEHQTGKRCLHDLTCLQKRCIDCDATELGRDPRHSFDVKLSFGRQFRVDP
jgi:hypothetical protein